MNTAEINAHLADIGKLIKAKGWSRPASKRHG